MSGERSYKLVQIATELNVSPHTLAQELTKLGHDLGSDPLRARISEEVYQKLMAYRRGQTYTPSDKSTPAPTAGEEITTDKVQGDLPFSIPIKGKINLPPPRKPPKSILPAPPVVPVPPVPENTPPAPETTPEPPDVPSETKEEILRELGYKGKIDLKPTLSRRKPPPPVELPALPLSPPSPPAPPPPSLEEKQLLQEVPLPPVEEGESVVEELDEDIEKEEKTGTSRRRRKRIRKKRKEIGTVPPPTAKAKGGSGEQRRPVKSQIKSVGDVATRRRFRQEKYKQRERKRELEAQEAAASASTIRIAEYITAAELAKALGVPVNQVIAKCLELGYPTSINQRLDRDLATVIAEEFGYKVEFISLDDTLAELTEVADSPEDLVARPPIVTVMGHVDHGKTTLLDYIRQTNVVAGEAGGITQHIGAYEVKLASGQRITFLDTPGHEAFTAMRARGAQITDIAIIVVAADDHVRPQTLEALNHAQAANVPIIFAINKIDKDTANPDRIRQELAEAGFLVEEWGGSHPSQLISAKKGIGVEELLEKVLILAELMGFKANPNRPARGVIIEAQLDKARGPVATVLVQTGTLRVGDVILAGQYFGKVRALLDERGKRIDKAGPSQPVQILGLNGVPEVGEKLYVLQEESVARDMANRRAELLKEKERRRVSGSLLEGIASGQTKQLNLIVKADVSGSLEALTDSLVKLSTAEVQVNVIHRGIGQITDSDVLLAKASHALIVGFQVRPSATARQLARQNNVEIRLYNVIYDIIDEVKSALAGMLAPIIQEETIGAAEVRQVFKLPKVGAVAGCKVIEGKILRGAKAHVIREGVVIYTSAIASLKRFKDDVKEVAEGFECGLTVEGFRDIKEGDVIECFEQVERKRTL
ncbi:MAG: translation initiation factor IF-2 [Bacteroidia bacterium]|nr:translation initiation factor IF-2 [Bacteroidia bacterium]MDW8235155.1 translation initiation factor IF-2 [Bacteroidia bacterium]